MGEKSWDLPLGEGWPGDAVGKVAAEGFVKVEKDGEEEERKDVNGGEVELELKERDGRETVVKEEVEFGRVEGVKGETEDKCVAEEKDCVEGEDAKEDEKRGAEGCEVRDEIGEDGVGMEEEEEEEEDRGIDEDNDAGLGCLNVNVESVEGIGG